MGTSHLTFPTVDDVAFAAEHGENPAQTASLVALHIGPLIELLHLSADHPILQPFIRSVASGTSFAPLLLPLETNNVIELSAGTSVLQLGDEPLPGARRNLLSIRAKQAALAAGFQNRAAGQLTAALLEMLDNIADHSNATSTGIVAFKGQQGQFEFVVADRGIGALRSLRTNPKFAQLETDRDALPLVLENGTSRFSDPTRGKGFNDLFTGLANYNGQLRFRSGDAAVTIDGTSPSTINRKIRLKPSIKGFLASVSCSL